MPSPYLPLDVDIALNAWIAALPEPRPSLEEAISLALRIWLTELGLLPFHDAPEEAIRQVPLSLVLLSTPALAAKAIGVVSRSAV